MTTLTENKRTFRRPRTPLAAALVLVAGVALAGCASTHPELDEARGLYSDAAADPELAERASVELYEARKTLRRAEVAWEERRDREEASHLAYVTQRRIEIARVSAERKTAEAEIEQLSARRDRFVLETRTHEADSARDQAERRAIEAEERAREALMAREEAERRAQEALDAREQAEVARARAEQLEQELREVGARATDRGHVLTLGDVLFDFGRADLKPGAVRTLDRLVQFLEEHPERDLTIEGHTDSVGDPGYNRHLSESRARSVRSFLVDRGVSSRRVEAQGHGEQFPVAGNESQAGRQRNRRVEVIILRPEGQDAAAAAPAAR